MRKNKVFRWGLVCLWSCLLFAQPRVGWASDCPNGEKHRFEIFEKKKKTPVFPKGIHQRQRNFIVREVAMTPEEASRFFPLYDAQKRQLHEIRRKIRKACQRIETEKLSEKDCERVLREIQKLRKQYAGVEAESYKQWEKCLPASKIIKVLNAERKFNRQFLKSRNGGKKALR